MSLVSYFKPESRKRLLYGCGAFIVLILITAGIFASNGWFPRTDPMSGKRTGWFGTPLAKNAPSSWNPVALPDPTSTPQLSKEYIYAGSRLLAVEDANASAAPPSDLAVWRSSNGTWYVLGGPGSSGVIFSWGQAGDEPIPGDFDGDGKTDFSVFRPGTGTCPCAVTWYIIYSSTGAWSIFQYAMNGDLPAQADYDGDGRTDPAIYRPPTGGATNGVWHIQGTSAGYYTHNWGETGDIPASADYDGDGKADLAVWRPTESKFYSINSSNGNWNTPVIGQSGTPVSSDYDGDGRADFAIYDQATANWYVRSNTDGAISTTQWGAGGDLPVQNDYDGDGKVDFAVWTPSGTNVGRWHIRNSSNGSERNQPWGQAGDTPVPAAYRR